MIPVQVSEQDGALEGTAGEQRRDPAQAGAGVQDERRTAASRGRSPRTTCAPRSGGIPRRARGSTADPAEVDPHVSRGRRLRVGDPLRVPREHHARTRWRRRTPPGSRSPRPAWRCGPAFEVGSLAEHRPRAVLGEPFAVPLHPDHAVQDEVDRGSRFPWRTSDVTRAGPADDRLGRAVHELHRQRPFQGGLDRGDQRRGVLVAPRAVLAERRAGPAGVVGQAGLVGQVAVGAVDPVPGDALAPVIAGSAVPSACRVSVSVVHTSGASHCT